jgi:hypothetical protein
MSIKQKDFYNAIINNNLKKAKKLLSNNKVNPSLDNNYAIRLSASCGYTSIVEILLNDKRVNPNVLRNIPLMDAITEGCFNVVELLLKDERFDPTDYNNTAIILADFSK